MTRLGHPGDGGRIILFEGGRLRVLALFATTALLLAIQNVLDRFLPLSLDFATLLAVFLALESQVVSGAVLALLTGYLGDLASGESRGLVAASSVLVFLLLRLSVVRLTGSRWLMITGISVIAVVLALFLRLTIESLVGPGRSSFDAMSSAFPGLVLGAALFGYPVYRLVRLVDNRFRTREDEVTIKSFTPRRS